MILKKGKKQSPLQLGNKERNEKNIGDYMRASSHEDIRDLFLFFALRITKANSLTKCWKHADVDVWISLKMKSFRYIQIHQLMTMILSMKKGSASCNFKFSRVVNGVRTHHKANSGPTSLGKVAMNKQVAGRLMVSHQGWSRGWERGMTVPKD